MEGPERPILIVEDDAWTREALLRLLRLQGLPTLAAATVSEGLALLAAGPRCVILDLNLADGHGEAFLRTVREEGTPCRVVVLTCVSDARRLESLARLGPDVVLTKPAGPQAILAACLEEP